MFLLLLHLLLGHVRVAIAVTMACLQAGSWPVPDERPSSVRSTCCCNHHPYLTEERKQVQGGQEGSRSTYLHAPRLLGSSRGWRVGLRGTPGQSPAEVQPETVGSALSSSGPPPHPLPHTLQPLPTPTITPRLSPTPGEAGELQPPPTPCPWSSKWGYPAYPRCLGEHRPRSAPYL